MNKKNKLFFLVLLATVFNASSQTLNTPLSKADSLFRNQRFTQSFELYDSIYHLQKSSPAMLLKMAYIKEGLGDYTWAQYYLNEYYLATNNDLALTKMENLAKEKDLRGYETNDSNLLLNLYYKHFQWLVLSVFLLISILFVFFIIQLRKYKQLPAVTSFFLVTTIIALFILINFGKSYNKALIIKNNSFIMAGPSAGADVIDVIGKGNKISIEGQKDVWLKIDWEGQTGYVKSNNVKRLSIW